MYKCNKCGIKYDLTDKHYNHISDVCDKDDICFTIFVCPGCKKERIVGGDSEFPMVDDEKSIMMFGYEKDQYGDTDIDELKTFEGVEYNSRFGKKG